MVTPIRQAMQRAAYLAWPRPMPANPSPAYLAWAMNRAVVAALKTERDLTRAGEAVLTKT